MAVGNCRSDVILVLSRPKSGRKPDFELRSAVTTLAGHFDGPPMQFHQMLDDGETEAESAVRAAH